MYASAEFPGHVIFMYDNSLTDFINRMRTAHSTSLSIYKDIGMDVYSIHISSLHFMESDISINTIVGAMKICSLLTHISVTFREGGTLDVARIGNCIRQLPFIESVSLCGGNKTASLAYDLMRYKKEITKFSITQQIGAGVARFPEGITHLTSLKMLGFSGYPGLLEFAAGNRGLRELWICGNGSEAILRLVPVLRELRELRCRTTPTDAVDIPIDLIRHTKIRYTGIIQNVNVRTCTNNGVIYHDALPTYVFSPTLSDISVFLF